MPNLIEAADRDPRNQTPERRFALSHARLILTHDGVVIPDQPSILVNPSEQPRFNLGNEWYRQVVQNFYLYGKELGIKSRWHYEDGMPKFPEQPSEQLNIPALVQTPHGKLTLVRMWKILEFAGNKDVIKEFEDWKDDPAGFQTPDNPYTTWMHDGKVNLRRKPIDIRDELLEYQRGGNTFDGLALAGVVYPAVLKDHYLDLPGSQYDSDDAPSLRWGGDRPWLRCSRVGSAAPRWGSVVAGRNINIGTLFS